MPRPNMTGYSLLLSCPGDVLDLKDTVESCVKSFNTSIGEINNIFITVKHWSTDSFSQSGDKPQNILNSQFVDDCDLCIALLGGRFGTPTDNYDSGTEEEIERMFAQNKQVFLYFVERDINLGSIDIAQYQKVQDFKKKYANKGVYTVVKSADELRASFQNALSLYFIKLAAPLTTDLQPTLTPELLISTDDDVSENIEPFYNDYIDSKFVHDKESEIASLIDEISAFSIEVSPDSTQDNEISEYTDEEVSNMTFGELSKAAEKNKVSTAQVNRFLGIKSPSYEPAEIIPQEKDMIISYCKDKGIDLDDSFWFLGNLKKKTAYPMITVWGNTDISFSGSKSEEEKYESIRNLIRKLREYNHISEYFKQIDAYATLSLIVSNIGNTYDEDIDVKLYIPKGCLLFSDEIPKPGLFFLDKAVDIKLPNIIFRGSQHPEIDDYSQYPIEHYVTPMLPNPFKSREDEIEEQRQEYDNYVERIFCYEIKVTKEFDVLCFNIPYLKQHTKMFFPSYLLFNDIPDEIRYVIRAKRSPDVYRGILTIKKDIVD